MCRIAEPPIRRVRIPRDYSHAEVTPSPRTGQDGGLRSAVLQPMTNQIDGAHNYCDRASTPHAARGWCVALTVDGKIVGLCSHGEFVTADGSYAALWKPWHH
jgi:hypothetical protein